MKLVILCLMLGLLVSCGKDDSDSNNNRNCNPNQNLSGQYGQNGQLVAAQYVNGQYICQNGQQPVQQNGQMMCQSSYNTGGYTGGYQNNYQQVTAPQYGQCPYGTQPIQNTGQYGYQYNPYQYPFLCAPQQNNQYPNQYNNQYPNQQNNQFQTGC